MQQEMGELITYLVGSSGTDSGPMFLNADQSGRKFCHYCPVLEMTERRYCGKWY